MPVSIFLPDLRGGGAERVMVTLAKEFSKCGHEVEIVLINRRGEYLDDVPEHVTVVSLDAPSVPGYNALGATPGLIKYLRSTQPDALLSALTRANLVAVLATELARTDTRLVLSERNHLSKRAFEGSDRRMRIVPKLVKALYPRADSIVAVSDGVADDLAETASLPRNHISTIYNPTVTEAVQKKQNDPIDHPWFTESSDPVVLGVGSLTEQKDFETLIRSFAYLREARRSKLLILGDGVKRAELESLSRTLNIREDIEFAGFVDNPFAYMAAADVFVLSSKWEGLPNVLIEAMACGTPVVSTDCPSGPREILQGGTYGPLVPVGDAEAIAEAIKQVLTDPISEKRLLERAEAFRPGPIAEQYLSVLLPNE